MKANSKKRFIFGIAAAMALVCYACSMPTMPKRLTIKTDNFNITLPGTIGEFNIVKTIAESLKDSLPEGFQIYNVVNYDGVKALLIGYEMELMESFNPDDYLDEMKSHLDDINAIDIDIADDISVEIELPEISWDYPSEIKNIDLSELFDGMKDKINDDTTGTGNNSYDLILDFPVLYNTSGERSIKEWITDLEKLPSFMVFDNDDVGKENANFKTLSITNEPGYDNIIELTIALLKIDADIPKELKITIEGIALKGDDDDNEIFIGKPEGKDDGDTVDAILEYPDFIDTIRIDVSGAVISWENPPYFDFKDITAEYDGDLLIAPSYRLNIQPQVEDINLSGATGLKIGEIKVDLSEMDKDIIETIKEGFNVDIEGFLNAQISKGTLEITAVLPSSSDPFLPDLTYCNGVSIEFELYMQQDTVDIYDTQFDGLKSNEPWVFSADKPFDFATQTPLVKINSSEITIIEEDDVPPDSLAYSHIIIKAANEKDGIDFELFGDNLINKTLPIRIGMDMQVEELQNVNWELDEFPALEIDDINFGSDIPEYIKSITFSKLQLEVDFTDDFPEDLEDVLDIIITSKLFKEPVIKTLTSGKNLLFIISDFDSPEIDPQVDIDLDVAFVPAGVGNHDRKYITIPTLNLASGEKSLIMEGSMNIEFDWIEARINLTEAMDDFDSLSGTFPENDKDPFNIKDAMGDYLSDITLAGGIDAKLFLKGPTAFINELNKDGEIMLEFDLEWDGKPPAEPPLFNGPLTMNSIVTFPDFPNLSDSDTEYVFNSTNLPEIFFIGLDEFKGIDISGEVNKIITDLPDEMRFRYEMQMPQEFTVTKDMFDISDPGGGITALFAAIIPLNFIAKSDEAFINLAGMFDDEKDLFDREDTDKPVFGDVSLNSINISLDFGASFFSEAYLHINCKDPESDVKLFGDGGMRIGQGRNFDITLNSGHWDTINNNMIYPEIKLMFPQEANIRIPGSVMPLTITVSASGSYTIEF